MSYLFTKEGQESVTNSVKEPVRVASSSGITLAATLTTLDGVGLVDGDRVLLKDQSDPASENGLYVWSSGTQLLTRALGYDSEIKAGMMVVVQEGTSADNLFALATNNPIIVGNTGLDFRNIASGSSGVYEDSNLVYVGPAMVHAADDTNLTTPFLTIQGAVDALETADQAATVLIVQGTYPENVLIRRDQINLVGLGKVIINPTTDPSIVISNATTGSLTTFLAASQGGWATTVFNLVADGGLSALPRTNRLSNLLLAPQDSGRTALVVVGAGADTEFGKHASNDREGFIFESLEFQPASEMGEEWQARACFFGVTNIIRAKDWVSSAINVLYIDSSNVSYEFYDNVGDVDTPLYMTGQEPVGVTGVLGSGTCYIYNSSWYYITTWQTKDVVAYDSTIQYISLSTTSTQTYYDCTFTGNNLSCSSGTLSLYHCPVVANATISSSGNFNTYHSSFKNLTITTSGTVTGYGNHISQNLTDSGDKWSDTSVNRRNLLTTATGVTVLDTDGLQTLICTATLAVTLPSAASNKGRVLTFKKAFAGGSVTVNRAGADTIDGSTSIVLTVTLQAVTLQSDGGTAWYVLSAAY